MSFSPDLDLGAILTDKPGRYWTPKDPDPLRSGQSYPACHPPRNSIDRQAYDPFYAPQNPIVGEECWPQQYFLTGPLWALLFPYPLPVSNLLPCLRMGSF